MPQMVLPQSPPPGMQKDAGTPKSSSGRDPGDGESRYDSVSRAEQKRLDEKKTERREEAQAADESRHTDGEGRPESPGRAEGKAGAEESAGQSATSEVAGDRDPTAAGEGPDEPEITASPLTFAELQALLAPGGAQGTAATGAKGVGSPDTPEPLPQVMPANGIVNGIISGKGVAQGQGAPGLTSGLQLTEALAASLGSDNGRQADPSSLMASSRFQSALDVASQQSASTNAAKLSAEAALPLKGYATSIDVPVGHTEWGDKLVGKLSWLTARNMSVAEIHLTPPDMGPMEVKVRVHHEQANITVHAANPVVRDQLELHSHRLRDMLGEQGLSLAQFDVSDSPQQQAGEQGPGEEQGAGGRGPASGLTTADADELDVSAGTLDLSWKGEVDIFA